LIDLRHFYFMWLLLCCSNDEPALWLGVRLRRAGLQPLHILTPELLCFPRTSEFQLEDTATHSRLVLRDGSTLESEKIRGVINRIEFLPATCFSRALPADREYAAQEMEALLTSWLFSLRCPVVNPPTAGCLGGEQRGWLEWAKLATKAGLNALPGTQTCGPHGGGLKIKPPPADARSRERIWVCDSRCDGTNRDALPLLAAAVIRLAALAKAPLLELDLIVDRLGKRWLCGVNSRPDFRHGGPQLLDLLASHFLGEYDPVMRHTL
jgi:hypothetical protein